MSLNILIELAARHARLRHLVHRMSLERLTSGIDLFDIAFGEGKYEVRGLSHSKVSGIRIPLEGGLQDYDYSERLIVVESEMARLAAAARAGKATYFVEGNKSVDFGSVASRFDEIFGMRKMRKGWTGGRSFTARAVDDARRKMLSTSRRPDRWGEKYVMLPNSKATYTELMVGVEELRGGL